MRVTFLIPPQLDVTIPADRCFGCNYGLYPLPHIPSLITATLLKNNGFIVAVRDFAAEKCPIERFVRFIENDRSDVYVFFTVSLSAETDLAARRMIQNLRKSVRFIFCGTQPTYEPENFCNAGSFVIRGEPEYPCLNLVQALEAGELPYTVKGITWVNNGQLIHNPPLDPITDLDSLPIPDRMLLDHTPYFNPKLASQPHTAILTSRGCFGRCWYCVPNSLSFARELEYRRSHEKKPFPRLHSVERVIAEFRKISEQGFRSVTVLDDEFLWNEKRTISICDGIRSFGLEWICLARPDMLTERSVNAMAAAGCRFVDLGVESFNQEILDDIGKDIQVECIGRAIALLQKYHIEPKINILFGASSKETEQTLKETIIAAERTNARYVLFGIATPFPGTEFYTAARKNHWFITPDNDYHPVDPTMESIIGYPHLPKERLDYYLSYAYRRQYFRPRYLLGQLRDIRSLDDLRHKLHTGAGILRRHLPFRLHRGKTP